MTSGAAIAALPMYDWPELRTDTDALWSTLRESLRDSGFDPPDRLTRQERPETVWRSERLLLGQTCGLPFVRDLEETCGLIGTPAYDIECGAGSYFSTIVVRIQCDAEGLEDLSGLRFAYNSRASQSGYFALAHALSRNGADKSPFSASLCAGSHREAIRAVAENRADIAAIDAVSWEIAKRHEPLSGRLRVLGRTEPTPGLPFICARRSGWNVDHLHMAVVEAMASLDIDTQHNLLLAGFAHTVPSDYRVIRQRYEATRHLCL